MRRFNIGYIFSEKRTFSKNELKKMARDCGDINFIHHDEELAEATSLSGIVASGSALAATFSAMIPSHFSIFSPMIGLEMSFKFLQPVRPEEELSMKWCISDARDLSNGGQMLDLEGQILDSHHTILVSADAKIMLKLEL